jgi:hypothetical protein
MALKSLILFVSTCVLATQAADIQFLDLATEAACLDGSP